MAGIDYTIPGQFKGIQIEPPMNAMARAMELRNLQDTLEVNALKRQEAQEMTRQRNALAQLHATPGVDISSENYLTRVSQVAPLLLPDIASQQLKRLELKEKTQSLDLKQREQEAKNLDLALNEFNRMYNPALISSAEEAEARTRAIYGHPVLGPRATSLMPLEQAVARSRQEFERNPQGYVAAQLNLSGKDIIEVNERRAKELRESAEKSYPAYQLAEFEAGREPLPFDQYVAQRTGVTRTPTLAPAAAPTPEMVGGTGEMVTLPDGTKQIPAVVKTEKKPTSAFGADVHPLVPTLLAGGNKEMATIVQEGHKATGALRQINDAFKELERLETEKPKGWEARSKALRDYIKVVSTEGPGTRVNVVAKLPEGVKAVDQKYAQDYLDWRQGGGTDAAANAGQIKAVLDRFAAGERLSGPSIGLAPDFFNALMNPQALGAKQQVEEVVQRNLRAVLGAQFTQVEGERLISRAFDARLSPQENAKRLRKLFMQIQTAAEQKEAMAQYYEANETLRGFKGKTPSINDFYSVLNAPDAPPKGSVDVKGPDGKTYRFPNQKAADAFKKEHGIKD